MAADDAPLRWIDSQAETLLRLVTEWSQINSWTQNVEGIERLAGKVEAEFASLGADCMHHDLPPYELIDSSGQIQRTPLGKAFRFVKRSNAPVRVLLNIHLDTVYPPQSPFQSVSPIDANILRGPGVADAKGGLVVMLTALRAFEQSEHAAKLGWEVILNPDEEIGSPGSSELLIEAARRNHFGLVYEPSLPDGSLVGARKGSGNFVAVVRGRAAHAGRDFHLGRSAILALSELIGKVDQLQHEFNGVTINCGKIEGGGALNMVPDLAIGRFNVRVTHPADRQHIEQRLAELADQFGSRDGIAVKIHGAFHSPPKPVDARSARLFEIVQSCGKEMGLDLQIHASGGACDGNRLADVGLPVVDTLGPRGGHLHSEQEYIHIDSLAERAKLTASVLIRLASIEGPP